MAAYEHFFGSRYNTHSEEEGNTAVHIETQKMCYLLKMTGIEIGDFGYSWNIRGPFSPGLLAMLRSIDRMDEAVTDFYENKSSKATGFSEQLRKIDELRENLKISEHKEHNLEWVELLGSLTYISRTMFPGASFEVINRKLIHEKAEYCDEDLNRYAWGLLKNSGLLSAAATN